MTGISDLIAKKEQQARDDEREAIVKWLRTHIDYESHWYEILMSIERGEHIKGAK